LVAQLDRITLSFGSQCRNAGRDVAGPWIVSFDVELAMAASYAAVIAFNAAASKFE